MNEKPNRFEIWIFHSHVFGRSDWFKEKKCISIEEAMEFLNTVGMYFHNSLEDLDKYFDVLSFHNSHELKEYFKNVSSILLKKTKNGFLKRSYERFQMNLKRRGFTQALRPYKYLSLVFELSGDDLNAYSINSR